MKTPKITTILMIALLVVLLVVVLILAPKTLGEYQTLQMEQNATPTPTANVQSMMSVTIDPNNTPAPTAVLLKNGIKGDEVKKAQQRLSELGYYTGEVDGAFGPGTAEAVKSFQKQHQLDSDGVAGENTLTVLYSEQAQTFVPTPTPDATPSSLSKGDNNQTVSQMQQRLKDLEYYAGEVDGDFGGGTQEAVRLFQRQNGLDVDGIAAQMTLSALYSEDAKVAAAPKTFDASELPILINSKNTVDKSYMPEDLVTLRNVIPTSVANIKGSAIEGDRTAVAALQTMFEAAIAEGISGWQVSAGYRSFKYQQSLFDQQVQKYQSEGMSKEKATSAAKLTVADPGASEHHTGLAFDITVAGTSFKGTKQQIWLAKNCWDYGFIIRYQEDKEKITGIIAECWHVRYVGTQHSTIMQDKNQCLEEYLGEA